MTYLQGVSPANQIKVGRIVIEFLINNSYVLYANYFYLSIFLLCRLLRNFYC